MHLENKELLQILHDCAVECDHCYHACLGEQDVKMMARCIQIDRNCAEICRITASYIASGSEFGNKLIKLCAEICNACAEECAKHSHEHCKRCAEACRKCAQACEAAAKI